MSDILANDEHGAGEHPSRTDSDRRWPTSTATSAAPPSRPVSGEVDIEDLIPEETCVFTLTHEGYIKRTTLDTYQRTEPRRHAACRA